MRGVFLVGPPGAGKTTQGRRLAAALGGAHLSMGELVRAWRAGGVPVPSPRADGAAARDRTLTLLRQALPPTELLVMDGFPRTPAQAAWLPEIAPAGVTLVELRAPLGACIARMKGRGRAGEDMATIALRHDTYDHQAPVLRAAAAGLGVPVRVVEGEGNVDEVASAVLAALADAGLAGQPLGG